MKPSRWFADHVNCTKNDMWVHGCFYFGRLRRLYMMGPNEEPVELNPDPNVWKAVLQCESWMEAMAIARAHGAIR